MSEGGADNTAWCSGLPSEFEVATPSGLPDAALIGLSVREKDSNYRSVIVRVDDKTRVISCKDNLQWIVQRYQGDQWRGVSFCRTREVLIREVRRRLRVREADPLPPCPPAALAVLMTLPERHGEAE